MHPRGYVSMRDIPTTKTVKELLSYSAKRPKSPETEGGGVNDNGTHTLERKSLAFEVVHLLT